MRYRGFRIKIGSRPQVPAPAIHRKRRLRSRGFQRRLSGRVRATKQVELGSRVDAAIARLTALEASFAEINTLVKDIALEVHSTDTSTEADSHSFDAPSKADPVQDPVVFPLKSIVAQGMKMTEDRNNSNGKQKQKILKPAELDLFLKASGKSETVSQVVKGSITVCNGKDCRKQGSAETLRSVETILKGHPEWDVAVRSCKCLDECGKGPVISTKFGKAKGQKHKRVKAKNVAQVLKQETDIVT